MTQRFHFDTFTNLIKTKGIKRAEEYRDSFKDPENKENFEKEQKTWIEEKKDLNNGDISKVKEEKDNTIPKEEKESSKDEIKENGNKKEEKGEEVEVSRDDLKEKLKNADIKFFNGAKTEKLLELCIENNLI